MLQYVCVCACAVHLWEKICLNCMPHLSPPICVFSMHTTAQSLFLDWANRYAGPALWSSLLIFLTRLHYSILITLWLMASLLLIGGLGAGLMSLCTRTCWGESWRGVGIQSTSRMNVYFDTIWRHAVGKWMTKSCFYIHSQGQLGYPPCSKPQLKDALLPKSNLVFELY